MLGHRPDEFGLVPDIDGFVSLKELLKAIHEEEGWSYVRQSHINEVLLGKDRPLFQFEDNSIRTVERQWKLDIRRAVTSLPKILFTPVRARAHPFVMDKGLRSDGERYLVLTSDRDMALRIGKRRDQKPVLLEVVAAEAQKRGVLFYQFDLLFLSSQIPAKFITGPPVSKKILEQTKNIPVREEKPLITAVDFTPGTFSLDSRRDPDLTRRAKGRKPKSWKENARKLRRTKKQ